MSLKSFYCFLVCKEKLDRGKKRYKFKDKEEPNTKIRNKEYFIKQLHNRPYFLSDQFIQLETANCQQNIDERRFSVAEELNSS